MRSFADVDALCAAVGQALGAGSWRTVDDAAVRGFAALVGGPVAPEHVPEPLLLALIPALMSDVVEVRARSMGINYGLDRARFPAPVPIGSRVRASARVAAATPRADGAQVVYAVTIEADTVADPACHAETVARIFR